MFLFADLNSYFASAEQQANPAIRGKPVGVCEHSGGIILAPSREAKKLGIKVGTPTWEAKKICPQIILLPVDPEKIRALTSRFYRIAEEYSDYVEHVSVDEVSINLGVCSYADAATMALEIKDKMKQQMGEWVTASIGIAESRLLAKIATDLQKPDGLVAIVNNGDECQDSRVKIFAKSDLYDLLALQDVPGIGSRLKKSLSAHGIQSLRELSQTPVGVLHSWYGVAGVWLHDLSNFRDAWSAHQTRVESPRPPKIVEQSVEYEDFDKDRQRDEFNENEAISLNDFDSRYGVRMNLDERRIASIGHQYSLGKRKALHDASKTLGLFWKLAEKVTGRMRKQGVAGDTVSVYLGYASGGGVGGSHRTHDFFDDTPSVIKVAERKLSVVNFRRGITFISVTVSGLRPKVEQGILFEDFKLKKELGKTIDQINERFGDFTVFYAPTVWAADKAKDTVGFGRTRERKDWRES